MNLFRISFMKYYLKFPFRSRFLTKLRDNNIEIFIWKYLCFPSVQSFKDYISTKWIYFEYCLYCIFLSHHMVQDFGTISRIILLKKIDMKMSEFLFCPIIYVVNVRSNLCVIFLILYFLKISYGLRFWENLEQIIFIAYLQAIFVSILWNHWSKTCHKNKFI